jgi:hypothetical protein
MDAALIAEGMRLMTCASGESPRARRLGPSKLVSTPRHLVKSDGRMRAHFFYKRTEAR